MSQHLDETREVDALTGFKNYSFDYSLDHSQPRTKTEIVFASFKEAMKGASNVLGELREIGPGYYEWGPNENGRTGKAWVFRMRDRGAQHKA